jgi:hypothetical protein
LDDTQGGNPPALAEKPYELLRTPCLRSSQKTASLSTRANRGEVEGWA